MGHPLLPPAGFDLIDSLARLRGTDVEIVLREPTTEFLDSARTVVLGQRRRRVTGTVDLIRNDAGTRLVCRVPRAQLADGIWSLRLHGDDTVQPVEARLLVQGRRPVVLLWGARAKPSVIPSRLGPHRGKQRVAAAAGRVLDAALRPLPPARAERVREGARRVARNVVK